MTSRDFCYWLQGFFEMKQAGLGERSSQQLTGLTIDNPEQVDCIRKHLAMVFHHEIDPSFGKDNQHLNKLHGPAFNGPLPTDKDFIARC